MYSFTRLGLQSRIQLSLGFALILCTLISVLVARQFSKVELREGMIEKARTVHSRLDAATEFIANQGALKPTIERFASKYKSASDLSEQERSEVLKQVPIFAAMKIAAKEADKEHYDFRVFSDQPRRKENLATPAELEVLKRFERDPNLREYIAEEGSVIKVYRPVRLTEAQGCMTCHGNPSTSPWHNGKDILGFEMENWQDGKLHGVFTISSDMNEVQAAKANSSLFSRDNQITILDALGALAAFLFVAMMVKKPLTRVTESTHKVTQGASEVGNAIGVILGVSHELSNASGQQAQAVQQTAASMEEISSMVKKSAANAEDSQKASEASRERALRGQDVMAQMMTSMHDINKNNDQVIETIQASNQSIAEIVSMIREIGEKTQVINTIVFQTKLLSFNASVEAARAGEHGKGFAVVAEEVGKLAQMSGDAAEEISEMLDRSTKRVESIVEETKTKVETIMSSAELTVDRGVEVATECRQVLTEIMGSCDEVTKMVAGIAVASQEQSHGVTEVSKAIHQIDEATQTSASAANKCSTTSNELAKQVRELRSVAADLRLVVEGKITMNRFVWGEQYRLNVPSMDDEHKILIEKINQVAECLEAGLSGKGLARFQEAFQSLAQYTQKHFSDEEAYMASIRFMGLERHKEIHRALLEKVGGFAGHAASGQIDGSALMEFLSDWLMRHILGDDMKYARLSQKTGSAEAISNV